MICSLTDICTSAGMSGDVWLIFTAASRKPRPLGSFSLSAMVPGGLGLCTASKVGLADVGLEVSLLLQDLQHSFQKRKRKTATRATPDTITTTARRLMEVPALGMHQAGRDRDRQEVGRGGGEDAESGAHAGGQRRKKRKERL